MEEAGREVVLSRIWEEMDGLGSLEGGERHSGPDQRLPTVQHAVVGLPVRGSKGAPELRRF